MSRAGQILVAAFVGGIIFGVGLTISQMTHPEVVLDFLQLDDFGLLLVMGGELLWRKINHPPLERYLKIGLSN